MADPERPREQGRVFLAGLPPGITSEFVQELAERHGKTIGHPSIATRAFVGCASAEDAARIVAGLDGVEVDGYRLHAELAYRRTPDEVERDRRCRRRAAHSTAGPEPVSFETAALERARSEQGDAQ